MKITKTRFEFESEWDGKRYFNHKSKGSDSYTFVEDNPYFCQVGSKLNKWLGKKARKVKIIVVK